MSERQLPVDSKPCNRKSWIGLDIGGANIKVAWLPDVTTTNDNTNTTCHTASIPFQLWKYSSELASFLLQLLSRFPGVDVIAVTMTGELADCYSSRKAGVCKIVDDVELAKNRLNLILGREEDDSQISRPRHPIETYYYAISDDSEQNPRHQWFNATQAKQNWSQVAAANWHAIATWAGRFLNSDRREQTNVYRNDGILIDIGSTTTDIIPIKSGEPHSIGKDDFSRLKSGELFYAGVGRTPICSLVEGLLVNGHSVSIAREFFATIEDALIVLGLVAENSNHSETADGRPATKYHSRQRLAKMLCNDSVDSESKFRPAPIGDASKPPSDSEFDVETLDSIAQQIVDRLEEKILDCIRRVGSNNPDLAEKFILSGQGARLAEKLLSSKGVKFCRLSDFTDEQASRSAAAVAVAQLAFEELTELDALHPEKANSVSTTLQPPDLNRLPIRVIKCGGSLLASIDTPDQIRDWINEQEPMTSLWMVGGGKFADNIRELDQRFSLGETTAHWLCLDLMTLNLRLLHHWFPDWPIRKCLESNTCNSDRNQLIDFVGWLRNQQHWNDMILNQITWDERSGRSVRILAESWDVTSDSCAAYFAQSIGADELVLLKSCEIPSTDLDQLAKSMITDPKFAKHASGIPSVRVIQLKSRA